MAFPAISTEVFGYPMHRSGEVALRTVLEEAQRLSSVGLVLVGT